MKRLNPETGKPFKFGDTRPATPENKGKTMFWGYSSHKKDGTRGESWFTPMQFFKLESKNRKRSTDSGLIPSGRVNRMIHNAKTGAKNRHKVFTITKEDILPALERGVCEVTGIPFDFSPHPTMNHNPLGPSIDRIDSDKGYTPDNIRIVLWFVNCALGECSDEQALPILKILVKALEYHAKKKSATPLSAGADQQGEDHPQYGSLLATWIREDDDNAHHHCGTISREDLDHRAQTSSGDSVAHRNKKVEPLEGFTRLEDNGDTEPEIVRLEFGSGRLFD